jgi:superfamily II DNA or RNA helicase
LTREQQIFDEFASTPFPFRNNFEPRDWQSECVEAYRSSVEICEPSGGPHIFSVGAGTGSGKTKAAGMIAAFDLNTKRVEQVVVVVPNRSILKKTQRDFKHFFGIDLHRFNKKKHEHGVPRLVDGYILTYGALLNNQTLHRQLCQSTRTLVIFDEVHHLSENGEWGKAAIEAFQNARFVLALTGTPYRPVGDPRIWPLSYEETDTNGLVRLRLDHSYPLGRAVADGVCRKPTFMFSSGDVQMRFTPESPYIVASFDDTDVTQKVTRERLRGAVRYGTATRLAMLRDALAQCRSERRKVIVFLGGDTEGDLTPTEDAVSFLPQELEGLGYGKEEYETVTGDDDDALRKIDAFGSHPTKWILVSINMVSEGTDIPELSAAIFLTSVTAKQTTVQRIGRALRLMGDDDIHVDALIFMFADPELIELGDEIDTEIKKEIDLRRIKRESNGDEKEGKDRKTRAESFGISGGELKMVLFHGCKWSEDQFKQAMKEVKETGLPMTVLNAVLLLRERMKGKDGHN